MPTLPLPIWVRRVLLGSLLFLNLAVPTIWKRLLILLAGVLIGFLGPVLALGGPLPVRGQWIWDAFAAAALAHGKYSDIILAILPAVFVCFTDYMNHVLDEDYRFSDDRILYCGLFTVLFALILAAGLLPILFTALESPDPALLQWVWFARADYSWPFAKLTLVAACVFEVGLGTVEARRQKRVQLAKAAKAEKARQTRADRLRAKLAQPPDDE